MAISEDASTPGAKTGTVSSGTLTVTSNSFSPPTSSLLVAIVSIGHGPAANPSIAVSDSGSHSWNTGPVAVGTDTWAGLYWTYLTGTPGSITVSAQDSSSIGQGIQLDVRVLLGAAQTQTGAASNTNTGTSSTSWTGSLTTTTVGSWVYLGAASNEESASISPNANTTTLNNFQASGGPSSQLSGRQSSSTGTTSPGATTFGWTTTSSAVAFAWAALEILPAPTAGTNTDFPSVNPGTTWLHQFKPQWSKPIPPVPPFWAPISSAGSFTLAGLSFSGQVARTSPDQPVVQPGPIWLSLYKPWIPHRPPFPSTQLPLFVSGRFALGPLKFPGIAPWSNLDFLGIPGSMVPGTFEPGSPVFVPPPLPRGNQVSQTSPDLNSILPGPAWLDTFKPQWPKPRPPVPEPIPPPPLFVVGVLTLGPLAFTATVIAGYFLFIGHYPVYYLDYIDNSTLDVLFCLPNNFYKMTIVSSRAGLTIPPRDGRWLGTPGLGDEIVFHTTHTEASEMLRKARALNSDMQARLARGEKIIIVPEEEL